MTETQLSGLDDEALRELAEQSTDPLTRELARRFSPNPPDLVEAAYSDGYDQGKADGLAEAQEN